MSEQMRSENISAHPIFAAGAELSAVLSSPNTNLKPDGFILLLVKVTNNGPAPACGIEIRFDPENAGLRYAESSGLLIFPERAPAPIEPESGGACFFVPPACSLPAGQSFYLSFLTRVIRAEAGATVYQQATVSLRGSNECVRTNVLRFTSDYAELRAEKTTVGNGRGCFGETVLTVTLSNDGNLPAQNIFVSDILPIGFSVGNVYYNGDPLAAAAYTVDADARLTVEIPGEIAPGRQSVVQITGGR